MNIQTISDSLWDRYCDTIPALSGFKKPTIIINNRTYTTAGKCFVEFNNIELSGKLLSQHYDDMILDILPHEICHQIDYNLNPTIWTMRNAHSNRWVKIGDMLGLKLTTYHKLAYIRG